MDLFPKTNYHKLERYSLIPVLAVAFFISTDGLDPSYSQSSQNISGFPNQTSISQNPGIPIITAGILGQERTQRPEQQQQQYSLYENPQNNFSIQYPSEWTVRQGGRAGVIATFSSPYESNFDPFTANLVVGVEDLSIGASLDNYTRTVVALLQSQPPGGNFNLTGNPVATTFGGLPAQRMGFTMTAPNERSLNSETIQVEGMQVWTVDNNTAYVLSFASEQDKFAGYSPIMEHIIDTFRITRTDG